VTGRGSVMPGLFALSGLVLLVWLGVWQIERRAWKLQLIERVDQRVHAVPSEAPGPERWSAVTAASEEYRHVVIRGEYLPQGQVLVQALTRLGAGYWVLTPLRTAAGVTVLINRGFIPDDLRLQPSCYASASGQVTVQGLLRISEPRGRFLRRNRPAEQRWYSRDVAAIAGTERLHDTAPYFIDLDASAPAASYPIGGLTVISFPNNHLLYACTWFGLAALGVMTLASGRRQSRRQVLV
jgi:surfeit locus 1 family protein